MTDLQRDAKKKLGEIHDYAVIQRHGKDVAFVLHPELGKVLLDSGLLEALKNKRALPEAKIGESAAPADLQQPDQLIGQVLRELSKK